MPRLDIRRSIRIDAAPDKVFHTVADFGSWTTWSPWLCAEPDATVEITSDPSSVGAIYAWRGDVVGEGEVEHRHLDPPRWVQDEIRFVKPFKSKSEVRFELEPRGEATEITWYMRGSLPWFLFWMKSQMETMIGMDYDRGLKMLKEWIETGAVESQTIVHGVQETGPWQALGVRKQCAAKDIGPSMDAAFSEVDKKFEELGLAIEGDPIAVYHEFDMQEQTFDYTSGYVVGQLHSPTPAGLCSWSLPRTRALHVEHIGSYGHLGNSWSAAYQIARYKKLKIRKADSFELYKNDAKQTASAELRTEIYLPLR